VKLIKYNYYNFGKINNDVVKNYVSDEYEYILFSNNDVEVKNDVIGLMSNFMSKTPLCGTVGSRLHFADNTIQHCGVTGWFYNNMSGFHVTHLGLRSYYNFKNYSFESIGNTAALMMIRKNVFLKCGMFNEEYLDCFEDVELNLKCLINGYKNYTLGKSVAIHYESQTRNLNPDKLKNLQLDYSERLYPFVIKNFNKLKNKIPQT
jgi:GT2 family glycosyltransferase